MPKKFGYPIKSVLIWIFANILGFGALGVSLLLFPAIMSIPGIFPATLIIAVPISLAQWIALRRIHNISFLWIFTIPVGLLLAISILQSIPDRVWQMVDDESIPVLTAAYLVIGFVIGLPQWLILRYQLPNSPLWLLGSSIGLALGFWLIFATEWIYQSPILSYTVVVLIYTLSTGFILWLFLILQNGIRPNLTNTTLTSYKSD